MSPTVSIICPVYNAEKYIHRCIDSIIDQTFPNWELILVDDGSKDSSGLICDDYAGKDARINVIHKKNEGVSSARQLGLDNVRGDYVIHVDPDDWVENNMLEELFHKAKLDNADMVICDFYTDFPDKTIYMEQRMTSLAPEDILNDIFLDNVHGSSCNKLVRKACIDEFNAHFPRGVDYCEDVCFNVQLLVHNIKIVYLPKSFYHYVQYNSSLTNHYTVATLQTQKKYIDFLCSLLPQDSMPIVRAKILVKKLAFKNKILTKEIFAQLYPEIKYTYDSNKMLKKMYDKAFTGHHFIANMLLYIYNFFKHQ